MKNRREPFLLVVCVEPSSVVRVDCIRDRVRFIETVEREELDLVKESVCDCFINSMDLLCTLHKLFTKHLSLRTLLVESIERLLDESLSHLVRFTGREPCQFDGEVHELLLECDESACGAEHLLDERMVVFDPRQILAGVDVHGVDVCLKRSGTIDCSDS